MIHDKKLMHPNDLVSLYRWIYWGKLKPGIYELELISYYDMRVRVHSKDGGYLDIPAMVCCDNVTHKMVKGEHILMNFPYKTYVNALFEVPVGIKLRISKSNMQDKGNVYIKFQKKSKSSMEILDMQPRECDPELKRIADELLKISNYKYEEDGKE